MSPSTSDTSAFEGLSVRGLAVAYGDLRAVDGVDLEVAAGEIVALLGASGSGKSSLLRAVAGLEDVAAGEVAWDGRSMVRVPVHKRGFGLMFQDGQLFEHRDVGGLLGLLGGAAVRGTGVETAGVAVVDDVLELVQQCQAAARCWLAAVETDDPVAAVPAAEARHRQGLAHHPNVRQGSDPLVGRCAGLPWAAGEVARQCGSLPLGHGKRLAEAAARAWNEGSEATQDRVLRGVHKMPPFM